MEPSLKLFVPGRICLFGEHSDWAGGYRRINPLIEPGLTLICGTQQGIHAQVSRHPGLLVMRATTPDGERLGPYEIPMQADALLLEARSGSFWSYIAGVAYQALISFEVGGLVIDNYKTDLPLKKGLSSSAAICVLAARAFNQLYDLKLSIRGEMELAYQGEITTPSRCGRMDQGCAFGPRPVQMTFDGDILHTQELDVAEPLYFILADLQAQKDTRKILADLNRCYPFAENELARGVQDLLGSTNLRIVRTATEALRSGDGRRLGELMSEAQSLFDRYAAPVCPDELTAPRLHAVLGEVQLQPHIWGGKGVGSQGDGSVQFIARSAASQQAAIQILKDQLHLPAMAVTLWPGRPVRKAVIPAAGFGARLFPATRATKKEFFPIVDRDGLAKPAILILVEEALTAGIEEVILVVQPGDVDTFRKFFAAPITAEDEVRLSTEQRDYARRIREMSEQVRFVVQHEQLGFGHAVYCARQAVGEEPFLLMLGDQIYRSKNAQSCTSQLLDAYVKYGKNLLGLYLTPEAQVSHFGAAAGRWLEENRVLEVSALIEKPPVEIARRMLQVPSLPAQEYLTIFGLYVLAPRLFDILEDHITRDLRERGEFQLTTALERLRQEDGPAGGMLGVMIEGQRFDIGQPQHYLDTLQGFSSSSGSIKK